MPSRWQASPRSARGVPCPLSPPRLPPREEVPSALCCSPVPAPFSLPVPEGLPECVLLWRGHKLRPKPDSLGCGAARHAFPVSRLYFQLASISPPTFRLLSWGSDRWRVASMVPHTTPSLVLSTASPETR